MKTKILYLMPVLLTAISACNSNSKLEFSAVAKVASPACSQTDSVIVAQGQNVTLNWTGIFAGDDVTVVLSPNLGSFKSISSSQVVYTAPASVTETSTVQVTVTDGGASSFCSVRLQPGNDALGLTDDGSTQGCVGTVVAIPPDPTLGTALYNPSSTYVPPQLSAITTPIITTIVVPNIDVPAQYYLLGFPVPGQDTTLTAWFGIDFKCTLTITQAGSYSFGLNSDDGSELYLTDSQGNLLSSITNNWKTQAMTNNNGTFINTPQASSTPVTLPAGSYQIEVPYFQGQPPGLGMEFFWKTPGSSSMVIVPASALSRPESN